MTIGEITEESVEQTGPLRDHFLYIDIGSIDRVSKRIVGPKVLPSSKAPSRAKQLLRTADVLVSMTRPNLNAVALVPPEFNGAIASTGFHVIRAKNSEPSFLYYAVQTPDFINAMCQKVQGALYPAVRPKDISSFILPPFSLEEQRAAVAEIEKQFTRLDAGVASLKRVQTALKRYRSSVLKAACEGSLVPTEAELARLSACNAQADKEDRSLPAPRPGTFYVYAIRCDNDSLYIGQTDDLQRRWNEHVTAQACDWTCQHRPLYVAHYEEHSSREAAVERERWLKTGFGRKWFKREIAAGRARQAGYETGEQLLQRILKERREKWNGKGKEPAVPSSTEFQSLPDGWTSCMADAVFTFVTSGSRGWAKYYSDTGPLFLRIGNLNHEDIRLDLKDIQHVEPPKGAEGTRTVVQSGDILISITADIGMIAVVPENLGEAYINQHVALARPVSSICTEYVAHYLSASEGGWRHLKKLQRGATKVGLGLDDIRSVPIPLPPLAEQERIVTELERRLSVIEELEAVTSTELQRASRLRQSVLHRAFLS